MEDWEDFGEDKGAGWVCIAGEDGGSILAWETSGRRGKNSKSRNAEVGKLRTC